MLRQKRFLSLLIFQLCILCLISFNAAKAAPKEISSANKLAYIVSDIRIPFWDIMARGAKQAAEAHGYELEIYSSNNLAKLELKNMAQVLKQGVAGIILSPTTSLAAATLLKMAKKSNTPVVIADIGADSDQYISYIGSDNRSGSYHLAQILIDKLKSKGWQDGSVGIIAIPQKRANGQARTAGFLEALSEHSIKSVALKQQVTFSYQETYDYAKKMIQKHPNLRAIWLQGSNRYQAALDAITDANRTNEILLICFDAEPEFMQLIPKQVIVGAAMQQPYLIGEKAVIALDNHLNGKPVQKVQKLPVLAISADNIENKRSIIERNVLGTTP